MAKGHRSQIKRERNEVKDTRPSAKLSYARVSVQKALKEAHIFDGMQERLMIIGYETGAVDEVMEQAADLYQKQLQDQIQKMIAVLEPTLVGILCVIVGIILLSVMLPLVGIMAGIG